MCIAVPSVCPEKEEQVVITGYPNPEKLSCHFVHEKSFQEELVNKLLVSRVNDCSPLFEFVAPIFEGGLTTSVNFSTTLLFGSINSRGVLYFKKTTSPPEQLNTDVLLNVSCITSQGMSGSPATGSSSAKKTFFGILLGAAPTYQYQACHYDELLLRFHSKVDFTFYLLELQKQNLISKEEVAFLRKITKQAISCKQEPWKQCDDWRLRNHNVLVSTESTVFSALYKTFALPFVCEKDMTKEQLVTFKNYTQKVLNV